MDFAAGPGRRQAGRQPQPVALQVHAQQALDEQPVHPTRRPGVPRPAAPAGVRGDRVDVRGDDVGLLLVSGDLLRGPAVMDGIEQREEFPGVFAVAHERKAHRGPDRAVRVLAAILAHPGDVTLDVTGIERGMIEGRIKQLDEAGRAADQALIHGLHGLPRPGRIAGAADHRPALREGIDLAFRIGRGSERFAIVEVGTTVPLAVPRMLLDVLPELACLIEAVIGEGGVVPRARQARKLGEHVVQEEGQPDALAAAVVAHPVHAVIPVAAPDEGQAVYAEFQAALDGAHAVLVKRRRLLGPVRQVVVGFLLGLDRPGLEEGNLFLQHAGVRDAGHVTAGRVGQPEKVVGKVGAHAAAGRRMPPMLHIALLELAGRGAEQVLAGQGRLRMHQRHHVLQLIAETVGAAGLVEARPAPQPAAQGLVQQPAVRHHVHRGIRRIDVHRAEGPVPMGPDALECEAAGIRAAKAVDEALQFTGIACDAQAEARFPLLSVGQVEHHLHRAAGVQSRPDPAGEPRPPQGGRLRQAAVPAQEFLPVAGDGARRVVHVEKHDAPGKLGVVMIAGQQRPGPEVHLGLHVQQALRPQVAQHPFPVARDRDPARPVGNIAQFQHGELHRGIHRDVDPKLAGDAVLGVLEDRVAEAVADDVGRRAPGGQGRRRPELAGLLVAQVKGLPGRVPHGIVAPRRQAEFVGVLHPGVGAAAFRDDRAEGWICDHVDPRGGRHLPGAEGDDVFVAIAGEAAESVLEDQLPRRDRPGRHGSRGPRGHQGRDLGFRHAPPLHLFRQGAMFVVQVNPGHGLQQQAVVIGDLLEPPDEDAAGLVQQLRLRPRGDEGDDRIVQGLAVDRDVLVQDDEFDRQSLHAPVGVRLDELPGDLDIGRVADAEQHERVIAGNAVAPQAALAPPVLAEQRGARPAGGMGVKERAGQAAVELGLALRGLELAERHLAVGPREVEGAVGHAGVAVFLHLREGGLPALGHAQHQDDDGGFMGRQADRAAERNDGIEDGAGGVGQRGLVLHRGRIGGGAAAPDKPETVGLAGDLPRGAARARDQVQEPRRPALRGAGAAGAEDRGGAADEFRLHEQVAERGVRRVRRRRREHHFGVAGHLNGPRHR